MAEDRKRNEGSLEAREYRDKEGNIHHHTKEYMHQHDGGSVERDRGEERRGKDEQD